MHSKASAYSGRRGLLAIGKSGESLRLSALMLFSKVPDPCSLSTFFLV